MKYLLLLSVAFLSGCATQRNVDAGPRPVDAQKRAIERVRMDLRDPDSMKNVTAGPESARDCEYNIYSSYKGWVVPVSFNSKNGFGGYVGQQTLYVWFQGNSMRGVTQFPQYCPERMF